MYRLTTILLLIASCLLVARAAVETTNVLSTPVEPTGTVCIQVVCPDPGADPSACPERCDGQCKTLKNACCPQSEIAVCVNEGGSSASASNSEPVATALSSSAASSPASSGAPAESSGSAENPQEGGSNTFTISYYLLPMALILVTKLL